MSKTSHCVCSPFSTTDSSLKHVCVEMPSPPLPPRTLRTNLYQEKKHWEQFTEKPIICNNDKVKCNCNRPHSCPAEEGSPPIPPKCNAQGNNKTKLKESRHNEMFSGDAISEANFAEAQRLSRKSSRHNSSDGGKTRKKSRSKSKPLTNEQNGEGGHQCDDQRYFMKTRDNLIDKNCTIFYKSNNDLPDVNVKLCKISENNETSVKFYPKPCEVPRTIVPQPSHPPDLIPDRCSSTKVELKSTITSTDDDSHKCSSKFRMKSFFHFWSKSKKLTENNRITTITPDESASLDTENLLTKPRRSKSLHLISGLSPASMHGKSQMVSPEIKTNSSSIFAVISPTTTRLRRNFLCISPKANNPSKKQVSTSLTLNNSKIILSENAQQRPGLSSLTGVRISPVHLMAGNADKCCTDKDINPNFHHYNDFHPSCGNNGELCRFHKFRLDHQEKGTFKEVDALNKSSSGPKVHSHHDASQRKTPQSSGSQVNRQLVVNNTSNTMCSCSNYRNTTTATSTTDNHCSNNSAYHNHFCQSHSVVPSSCGYMHNIIQFNPNHFNCCHGNQQLWCIVPCCSDQIPMKQHSFCSCHIYNQTGSSPANFSRQLPPPPPPPPPVLSFSNSHQFPPRYRQSYSKTPPPSFHTHQMSCHDDHHCYQECNLNQLNDSRQKMILSHHIKSNTFHSNCCRGFQKQQCCSHNQSKCSVCGSLIYSEVANHVSHYNLNEKHRSPCSNASMVDSSCDPKLIAQGRVFAPAANTDDTFNCICLYNQSIHQHSDSCDRHTNEMRMHSCRNSAHRNLIQPHGVSDKERSSSKRRKNSSHSCHMSNIDNETEEKHDLSKNHHNSPAANIIPSTSIHLPSEINTGGDMNTSINNVPNVSNSISNNMTASSSAMIQIDRKQQHFEPWRKTFHDNMMALRNLGWYWGPLNHLEAENLVHGRADGTFLVRDSGNEAYFLSLTFRVLGTTYHTRIEYSQGKFSFWSQPESHSATTIVEFIDKAVAHSVSGKFHYFLQTSTPGQPPMEVSLLYPLSRYQIVQSLQHLSRFIILSNIRRDHVSQLDLPQSIKLYLMEKQYYIDSIETFVTVTKDSEPLTYEASVNVVLTL